MNSLDTWNGVDVDITHVLSKYLDFTWTFNPMSTAQDEKGRLLSEVAVNNGEAEMHIGHMVMGDLDYYDLKSIKKTLTFFLK